tara:strand:+ start:1399 stop:2487 length:1089 start_codon:yes stop_codon:yes gene_type:complete
MNSENINKVWSKISKNKYKKNSKSPSQYYKLLLNKNIVEEKRKKEKVSANDFFILNYKDHNNLLYFNYNVKQLKAILKHYNQKISGNKKELYKRVYNYLKLSYSATIIQSYFRGYIRRFWMKIKLNNYKIKDAVNDTDFFSLVSLKEFKKQDLIFINDEGFIYCFYVKSLYNLFKKSKKPLNPYNRKPFTQKTISNLKNLISISKLLGEEIDLEIKNNLDSMNEEAKLKQLVLSIFEKIDNLGHITSPTWFLNLSRGRLIKFYRELLDIWEYRSQIPIETKKKIIHPHGKPFLGYNYTRFSTYNLLKLKKIILTIINDFLTCGIDEASKSLGAFYVLGALTIVSHDAATAMPWLYESFYYQN